MKIRSFICYSALLLCLTGLAACHESAEYRDVIYITGAEDDPSFRFTVEGVDSTYISVSASAKVVADTKVYLTVRPEMVEEYNRLNYTTYKFPPLASNFSFSSEEGNTASEVVELTIPAGSTVSDRAKLKIESFESFEDAAKYCIPVSISYSDKNIEILESSATKFVMLNRTIFTKAPFFNGNQYLRPSFEAGGPALDAVAAVTYEARIMPTRFQTASPKISSIMGIEEGFILRLGDSDIDNNLLQVALGSNKATGKTAFEANKWYHVAAVFDGASLSYTLYINGVKDGEFSPVTHSTIDLSRVEYHSGFNLGQSRGSRYFYGVISEARVWTRALSANEIRNNMCVVDPNSPGLLAYWRLNEETMDGTAMIARDLTENGYDAVSNRTFTYRDVKCPE